MQELNYRYRLPIETNSVNDSILECYAYYIGAFNYNWHSHVECLIVINGALEACIDGKTYFLEKDDMYIINSNIGHATLSKESETVAIVLHFEPSIISKYLSDFQVVNWYGVTNSKNRYSEAAKNIRNAISMIVNSFNQDDIESRLKRTMATYVFLYESLVAFSESENVDKVNSSKELEGEIARKLVLYLNDNYTKRIRLAELADLIGYHPNYTSDLFSRIVGIPFTEYLQRHRLTMATKDLRQSDKLISEIALEHGFTNIKAFNTAFKNSFGRSPSAYRSSLDEETKLIDAEFKKVFLDVNHDYWLETQRRWENVSSHYENVHYSSDGLDISAAKEEVLDRAIEAIENLKKFI